MNIIFLGILGSVISGWLATSLGGLVVLFFNRFDARSYSAMLSFSAGVMLAASFFSLLVPALGYGNFWMVVVGFIMGVVFLEICDALVPHEHFLKGREGVSGVRLKRISLFNLAITIHNFPEGFSVGVGFAGEGVHRAIALAIGIGIQNILEGAAVALPLVAQGYSRRYGCGIASLTGLVEVLGGVIGVMLAVMLGSFLPLALSFAAGCMLYVISGEIIPECHQQGCSKSSKIWLIVGFIAMMTLDNVFH